MSCLAAGIPHPAYLAAMGLELIAVPLLAVCQTFVSRARIAPTDKIQLLILL